MENYGAIQKTKTQNLPFDSVQCIMCAVRIWFFHQVLVHFYFPQVFYALYPLIWLLQIFLIAPNWLFIKNLKQSGQICYTTDFEWGEQRVEETVGFGAIIWSNHLKPSKMAHLELLIAPNLLKHKTSKIFFIVSELYPFSKNISHNGLLKKFGAIKILKPYLFSRKTWLLQIVYNAF